MENKSENNKETRFLIWEKICQEIQSEKQKCPFLFNVLDKSILNSKSFEEALCSNIATNLSSGAVPVNTLECLFNEIVDKSPEIVEYALNDLLAIRNRDFACTNLSAPFLFSKGFLAIQAYRMAHSLYQKGEKLLSSFIHFQAAIKFGIDINPAAHLGKNIVMDHGNGIVIGSTAIIEDHTFLFHNVTLGSTGKESGDRHPKIRSWVVIGVGATILGNIEVGEGAVVAAGSMVLKDVPPHHTVAGNPALIVGKATPLLQSKNKGNSSNG